MCRRCSTRWSPWWGKPRTEARDGVRCGLQDETLKGFFRNLRGCLSRTHIQHSGATLSLMFGQHGCCGPWFGPWLRLNWERKRTLRRRHIGLSSCVETRSTCKRPALNSKHKVTSVLKPDRAVRSRSNVGLGGCRSAEVWSTLLTPLIGGRQPRNGEMQHRNWHRNRHLLQHFGRTSDQSPFPSMAEPAG